jgi:hypothetical protein
MEDDIQLFRFTHPEKLKTAKLHKHLKVFFHHREDIGEVM